MFGRAQGPKNTCQASNFLEPFYKALKVFFRCNTTKSREKYLNGKLYYEGLDHKITNSRFLWAYSTGIAIHASFISNAYFQLCLSVA